MTPTKDQLLKESTAVAQKAAKQIGGTFTEGKGFTPTPAPTNPTTTAITADNLKPTPAATITPPATPTVAPKMQADLEVQTDDFTKALTEQKKAAETGKQTALTEYIDSLKNRKGLTTLTSEAYAQKGGVNDITPELNDINDQIRREQLAMRRAQEAIMAGGGQSKAQAQAQIANVQRESLAKQADLSIIQMAVQGRYDSAKEIADRAVSAQLEQQTLLNDALKFNYQENKDLFTVAEQREFETLLGNRTRAIQDEKDRLTEIKSFALQALQAGASVSEAKQMMNAKTLEEAMSIGGGYFRPKPVAQGSGWELKEVNGTTMWVNKNTMEMRDVSGGMPGGLRTMSSEELAKFNSTPEVTSVNNSTNYFQAIKNYKDSINKYGTGEVFGRGSGALGDAYSALVGATKDYYKLGTYDNGVEKLINLGIKEPSVWGLKANRVGALDSALETAKQKVEKEVKQLSSTRYSNTAEYQNLVSEATKLIDPASALPPAPLLQGVDSRLYTGNVVYSPDGPVELID